MTAAFASGAAGAVVLTALHETMRRAVRYAPRMDIVGMRALARVMRAAGATVPDDAMLHRLTLTGDLIANSLYYAAVPGGSPRETWARGAALGLAAGAGALALPEPLGLGQPPHSERTRNQLMTVGLYLAGGLAAAAVAAVMAERRHRPSISSRDASRRLRASNR
jgi:hypothetical protein